VEQNSKPGRKDTLKMDWSHMRTPDQVMTPPWRHPLLKSFRYVNNLPDRLRLFALASAHATSGNLSTLKRDWTYIQADSHKAGLEAILQTVAFSGFHRLHNALRAVHDTGVCSTAIDLAAEDAIDFSTFPAAGERTLNAIYTSSFGPLEKSIARMHPDMWCFIVEFAYGRVLARLGLSIAERELSALAVLVGNATFPQLRSHMRGALLNGAKLDQVRGILDQTEVVWGRPAQTYVDGFWLDFVKGQREVHQQELLQKGHM
jgi:4-carboxymuconolactone decarboxylase